eukprot:CAMPEP_0117689120 /NCGR_PEP_ID=MMETSP0804-20121206/24280_1 /TAXON_ID=1074897 /ORGANISM="Tetraselmis astigmatica, Strain CCMP880" /LENGTH=68 /DNA_ID=CAMNT_0005501791 /DNA_START=221 /DNA_END=427 /DNA_ORIENTATION=-
MRVMSWDAIASPFMYDRISVQTIAPSKVATLAAPESSWLKVTRSGATPLRRMSSRRRRHSSARVGELL